MSSDNPQLLNDITNILNDLLKSNPELNISSFNSIELKSIVLGDILQSDYFRNNYKYSSLVKNIYGEIGVMSLDNVVYNPDLFFKSELAYDPKLIDKFNVQGAGYKPTLKIILEDSQLEQLNFFMNVLNNAEHLNELKFESQELLSSLNILLQGNNNLTHLLDVLNNRDSTNKENFKYKESLNTLISSLPIDMSYIIADLKHYKAKGLDIGELFQNNSSSIEDWLNHDGLSHLKKEKRNIELNNRLIEKFKSNKNLKDTYLGIILSDKSYEDIIIDLYNRSFLKQYKSSISNYVNFTFEKEPMSYYTSQYTDIIKAVKSKLHNMYPILTNDNNNTLSKISISGKDINHDDRKLHDDYEISSKLNKILENGIIRFYDQGAIDYTMHNFDTTRNELNIFSNITHVNDCFEKSFYLYHNELECNGLIQSKLIAKNNKGVSILEISAHLFTKNYLSKDEIKEIYNNIINDNKSNIIVFKYRHNDKMKIQDIIKELRNNESITIDDFQLKSDNYENTEESIKESIFDLYNESLVYYIKKSNLSFKELSKFMLLTKDNKIIDSTFEMINKENGNIEEKLNNIKYLKKKEIKSDFLLYFKKVEDLLSAPKEKIKPTL